MTNEVTIDTPISSAYYSMVVALISASSFHMKAACHFGKVRAGRNFLMSSFRFLPK